MMITGQVGRVALGLANDAQAVDARHLQIGDEQVVRAGAASARAPSRPSGATSTSYSASASVFASRSRMLGSSSTTRMRGRALRVTRARALVRGSAGRCRQRTGGRSRLLAVEPRVDVALAEAPLPADAHRRDLPGLDQPVHGPKIDLQVLQDFFGREEGFINHAGHAIGSSTVNTAPPSGWLPAEIRPPWSWTIPYASASPSPTPCPTIPWSCRTVRRCAEAYHR